MNRIIGDLFNATTFKRAFWSCVIMAFVYFIIPNPHGF